MAAACIVALLLRQDIQRLYLQRLEIRAKTLALAGEYAAAIEKYEKLLEYFPEKPALYLKLAQTWDAAGDLPAAQRVVRQGLSAAPQPPDPALLETIHSYKRRANPYTNRWKSIYRDFLTSYLPQGLLGEHPDHTDPGVSVTLVDLDFDGVPELLSQHYIGNAYGDIFLYVYTIQEGEVRKLYNGYTCKIESLRPDLESTGVCLFRNKTTGDMAYLNIGESGASMDNEFRVTMFSGLLTEPQEAKELFRISGGWLDKSAAPAYVEWTDENLGRHYYIKGRNVPQKEYETAYAAFFAEWVRMDWDANWTEYSEERDSLELMEDYAYTLVDMDKLVEQITQAVLKTRFQYDLTKVLQYYYSGWFEQTARQQYETYLKEELLPQYGLADLSEFAGEIITLEGDTSDNVNPDYQEAAMPLGCLGASMCDMDADGIPEYIVLLSERSAENTFDIRIRAYTLLDGAVVELSYPEAPDRYALSWYVSCLPEAVFSALAPIHGKTYVCLELRPFVYEPEIPGIFRAFEKRDNALHVAADIYGSEFIGVWAKTLPYGLRYGEQPESTAQENVVWLYQGTSVGSPNIYDELFNRYYYTMDEALNAVLTRFGFWMVEPSGRWSNYFYNDEGTNKNDLAVPIAQLRINLEDGLGRWEDYTDLHADLVS